MASPFASAQLPIRTRQSPFDVHSFYTGCDPRERRATQTGDSRCNQFGRVPLGYSQDSGASGTAISEEETHMDNSWQTKWEGRWDQFKGKVKQTWGDVTDDDCDVAEGQYDELVGRIKSRTGETEEAIQRRLDMD